MNDTPVKKKQRQTKSRDGFVMHWMVGSTVSWIVGLIVLFILMIGIFLLIEGQALSEDLGTSIIIYVLILPAGAMMGMTQQSVLKTYLGLHVRNWWWVSALSWSLGLFLAVGIGTILRDMVFNDGTGLEILTVFWITLVMVVPASTQAWLLRLHVPQTWVYALSGAISGLICGTVLRDNPSQFWIITPIVASGLSALVLMWLTSPTTARMTFDADDNMKKKSHPLEG